MFIDISEMFILVPALLGLKGNLEMTLASRLSTAANLGELSTMRKTRALLWTNLMLVQVRATVHIASYLGYVLTRRCKPLRWG